MGQREGRRQRRIQKAIKAAFPRAFFFKVHGGPFQASGLPDLIGCVDGRFFGFEVKEPDGEPSDLQLETIADIKAAGGIAAVIIEPQEALDLIQQAGRATTARGTTLRIAWRKRSVLRAGYREDLDHGGSDRVHRRTRRSTRGASE